jgi:ketosteroid isomerase-like protein
MDNKKVVQTYIEGFNTGDHAKIISCLTDNVIWEMPGLFHLEGKEQFDMEIENDAFEGLPKVVIIRLIEDGQIVVAEGTVKSKLKNGELFEASFCDVFHFDNGKIKQLTGYIMPKKG